MRWSACYLHIIVRWSRRSPARRPKLPVQSLLDGLHTEFDPSFSSPSSRPPPAFFQIDPFGHSATQGSLMTSGFGFDALYFGRIHHVDLQHRHDSADCEGLWTSSTDESSVFWGLTGSYMGNYGGPAGFCFDVLCEDDPLVGESEDELVERIKNFTGLVAEQAERTKGRNVMLTMGMDFFYEEADKNFENLDLLIEATNRLFEEGIVDPSDYFGERFDEVKVFYSTPERYTKCKYADSLLLSSRGDDDDDVAADFASAPPTKHDPAGWKDHAKTGDFFPYADCEHCYWSGYFSSRQGLKRMERVGSSFLHAARQVESLTKLRSSDSLATSDEALAAGSSSSWNASPLYPLEDAVAIAQHHDAVAGTSKQHVAYDYAKRIAEGIGEASAFATEGLRELLLETSSEALENLSYCHLLNETVCDVSQVASQKGDEVIYVVAYNALAHTRSEVIPLPMDSDADYIVEELNADDWSAVSSSLIPNPNHARSPSGAHFTLYFEAKELPPLGASVFRVRKTVGPYQSIARRATESTPRRGDIPSRRLRTTPNFPRDELLSQPEDDLILSNGALSVAFDRLTGTIKSISEQREDGVSVRLQQEYGFYEAFARDESFNTLITEFEAGPSLKSRTPWLLGTDDPPQNAGAYIFRPTLDQSFYALPPSALPDSVVVHESDLVTEVHAEFGNPPWIKQITRLMDGKDYVDVEYAVGPVPIDDGVGKEVISRYSTTIESGGIFYTDSNGREFVKRRRGDARVFGYDTPDFNPEIEPIAGNYYPVNTAMYLEDQSSSFTILTDRSQGGSSLSDGSLELMIQRRLLHDDARGVGEPLNETDIGITHCIDPPPKCNVTRLGEGVTVKGSHRLMIGRNGATQARAQMDNVFSQPHIFVASEPQNSHVSFRHPHLSLSKQSLDRRIMVVTFAALEEENTFLVRLAHQYGKDEIMYEAPGVQSGPALVDMQDLFPDREIVSITEKTLSANQDRSDWESRRFQWDPDSTRDVGATVPGADFTVMLKPLEIRTFEISIR
ncbi:hypothetical protein ACHAWF_018221 [Thalassiosira exigua]